MEETLENLDTFYESFSVFTRYIDLFPSDYQLKFDLQDLYATYTDFCLLTIKYMSKGAIGESEQHPCI